MSLGISRGSWGRVVNCASQYQVWLILQDSHSLYGMPGKFLKTGIFTGMSLRKFPWLFSIDFNATMPLLACWGGSCTFCFSGLWDFSLGVHVKESIHDLWAAANCHAFGKTLRRENGRDLKAVSFTGLNWVKKIERSVAAVIGRWKISPVTSADYLRAPSEASPQKVLVKRLMANWEEMLHSLKNQQTLWMFNQAGKPNRNHQYAAI